MPESPEIEWPNNHKLARERISRLAVIMAEEFTTGHDATQTKRFESLQDEYLQAQTDLNEMDKFGDTRSHWTTG